MTQRRPLLALLLLLALAPLALAAPAHAGAHGEEKKKGGGSQFIQIRSLNVNVLRPGGGHTVASMEVGLYVLDPNLLLRADASQPRLRAALGQSFQGYISTLPPGGLPNADYLSQVLQKEADRVLGQRGAKLLVGTIMIN